MIKFRFNTVLRGWVTAVGCFCFGFHCFAHPDIKAENSKPETDYRHSVVRIRSWKQPVDISNPWQKKRISLEQHLGVLIDSQHILTTANSIMDQSQLEMVHWGKSNTYPLSIDCVDHEANLALLHAEDPKAVAELSTLPIDPLLELNQPVYIVKPYDQFSVKLEQSRLVKVGAERSAFSAYQVMTYLLEVEHEGFGFSEPVVSNGHLMALVSHRENQGILFAIPGALLEHFVKDCRTSISNVAKDELAQGLSPQKSDSPLPEGYRGFPGLGLVLEPLTSPNLRQWLGVKADQGGVRIERVYEDSPFFGKLLPNDVLLQVNDVAINEYGNYVHPQWGQIPIQILINQMYPNDKVSLQVIRNGNRLQFQSPLYRHQSNHGLIPWYRTEAKEPHVIFGGLVFQEVSIPYLKEWGATWIRTAPVSLTYPLLYQNTPSTLHKKRIIFLNQVLADTFNRGYQDLSASMLAEVNGYKIGSLEDLNSALQHPVVGPEGKLFAVFKFELDGGQVVLSYAHLPQVHQRIAKTYKIPATASFFTLHSP